MKKMTSFETWQVINMTIQSMLLLAAFLGALYVGLKQYEISISQGSACLGTA